MARPGSDFLPSTRPRASLWWIPALPKQRSRRWRISSRAPVIPHCSLARCRSFRLQSAPTKSQRSPICSKAFLPSPVSRSATRIGATRSSSCWSRRPISCCRRCIVGRVSRPPRCTALSRRPGRRRNPHALSRHVHPPLRCRSLRAPSRRRLQQPLRRRRRRHPTRSPRRSAWCRVVSPVTSSPSLNPGPSHSLSRHRRRAPRRGSRARRTCRNSCLRMTGRVWTWRLKPATRLIPCVKAGRPASAAIRLSASELTAPMRIGASRVCPGAARRLFRSLQPYCWSRAAPSCCAITKYRRRRQPVQRCRRRRRHPRRR